MMNRTFSGGYRVPEPREVTEEEAALEAERAADLRAAKAEAAIDDAWCRAQGCDGDIF